MASFSDGAPLDSCSPMGKIHGVVSQSTPHPFITYADRVRKRKFFVKKVPSSILFFYMQKNSCCETTQRHMRSGEVVQITITIKQRALDILSFKGTNVGHF